MAEPVRPILLLTALMLFAACGGSPDDHVPPEEGGYAAADTVIDPTARALSLAQQLDERLPFGAATVRRIEAPIEAPRTLRMWRENNRPVKLMVTESNSAAGPAAHSLFYLEDDVLFFARDSNRRFVFVQGGLTAVLDDQLDTLSVDPAELESLERLLKERLEVYLGAFNDI